MCIIAAKNKGVDFPDMDTIENMWYSNRDGAGLMWVEKSKVYISKGFMTLPSFKDKIKELSERLDLKNTPMVMHFRIGTHGGNIPENTHPFPIIDSISALQKLEFRTNIGVAHNGIIPINTRTKNISDTMEYIAAQLYPIKCIKRDFYNDKNCQKLIYNGIQSKMCFLNFDGRIYTIGDFTKEENGMIYSNSSYKPKTYYSTWDHGKYGHSLYGWDTDDYAYDNGSYYSENYYNYYKNKEKEEDKNISSVLVTPVEKILYKAFMWLDEESHFVVDSDNGEMYEGIGFLVDKDFNVYEYDFELDMVCERSSFSVFANTGCQLIFDDQQADYLEFKEE